ncbi:hypothetical protein LCGC14_1456230 [marine sediment metagenome]|uniref:Uncharacterized protein n=1 Tax=marine sediment metagenome TaxID=412755 RepID=A0A0F9JGC8_9ZZZZ
MQDNITEILTLDYEDQVNDYLARGWVLLGLVPQDEESEWKTRDRKCVKYILGKPRQYPCGAESFGHTAPKQYDHETGKWYCVDCKETEDQS